MSKALFLDIHICQERRGKLFWQGFLALWVYFQLQVIYTKVHVQRSKSAKAKCMCSRCFNHQKHMQFAHADSLQFGVHVGDHCLLLTETHNPSSNAPPKTNMEPENTPLGKGETSTQTTNFWVPVACFRGCIHQRDPNHQFLGSSRLFSGVYSPATNHWLRVLWEKKHP